MTALTRTGAIISSIIVIISAIVLISGHLAGLAFASIFAFLSFIVLALDLLLQIRLAQLKKKGNTYNAEIIDVKPGFFGKLECAYANERGERILFKTRPHILKRDDNAENLQVKIFVNRNRYDSQRYEVEVFRKKG